MSHGILTNGSAELYCIICFIHILIICFSLFNSHLKQWGITYHRLALHFSAANDIKHFFLCLITICFLLLRRFYLYPLTILIFFFKIGCFLLVNLWVHITLSILILDWVTRLKHFLSFCWVSHYLLIATCWILFV